MPNKPLEKPRNSNPIQFAVAKGNVTTSEASVELGKFYIQGFPWCTLFFRKCCALPTELRDHSKEKNKRKTLTKHQSCINIAEGFPTIFSFTMQQYHHNTAALFPYV